MGKEPVGEAETRWAVWGRKRVAKIEGVV